MSCLFAWLAAGTATAQSALKAIDGRIPVPIDKPAEGAGQLDGAFEELGVEGAPLGLRSRGFAPALDPKLGAPLGDGVVYLTARLVEAGPPLDSGVVWRVFNETGDSQQPLALVESGTGGDAEFRLPAGEYVIHAAYGQAGRSKRVFVGGDVKSETIVLDAGGLRLSAAIAEDLPLPPEAVTFDISRVSDDAPGGRETIASNVRAGQIYRVNAGTYQVVSHYGDVNAIVRAQITVQPGQLTDATIYHRAAEVTLKLVNEGGGEALANTAWSILTPGGDVVFEKIGAFPSVILAEGTYTIIAKHEIGMFSRQFSVEAGSSRDVEVLTIPGQRNGQ